MVSGSGSGGVGIAINASSGPAEDNVVLGNYAGTDVTDTLALGNIEYGVRIQDSDNG